MESGRRRQSKKTYGTKREAQVALAEAIAAHERHDFVAPTDVTLDAYADDWIDGLIARGRKPSTIRGYRANLRNYILPTLGRWKLQDLRTGEFDQLYTHLLTRGGRDGDGLSLTTVHQVHTQLVKMFNDAERKGLVVKNIARLADAPSASAARQARGDMAVWTPAELSRFLEHASWTRSAAMMRLLAMTGMRRGELVALEWSDVDLSAATVRIRSSASIVDGAEVIDSPKTRQARRTLDIDAETLAVLKAHRAAQLQDLMAIGAPTGQRVFTNEIGEPLRPNSIGQAFRRLVDSCDVPRIRLHDLRHTHATHLLAAGVNARVVSERLGHSSVSFTLDTYGHVMPGQQADAAAAAAALLTNPGG